MSYDANNESGNQSHTRKTRSQWIAISIITAGIIIIELVALLHNINGTALAASIGTLGAALGYSLKH